MGLGVRAADRLLTAAKLLRNFDAYTKLMQTYIVEYGVSTQQQDDIGLYLKYLRLAPPHIEFCSRADAAKKKCQRFLRSIVLRRRMVLHGTSFV